MESVKEKNKLIGLGVVAVVVVGVLMLSTMMQGPEPRQITVPRINVTEYSYKVTSDKPAATLENLATVSTDEKEGTELTVYNQDLALVKERREINLLNGLNLVKYKDIASQINPASVFFRDIDYEDTFVVEQNYEYDLVSKNKLLEKFLDKQITVKVVEGNETKEYSGALLSYMDGITLKTAAGVASINDVASISFPELPEGLLTKPTLVWKVYTENAGTRTTETSYLTGGMNWKADYIAVVNDKDTKMDFKGWTTINNNSGTGYPNTALKLVAGDIHRVYEVPEVQRMYDYALEASAPKAGGFVEEALFEYHMYTLQNKTDLKNNESKQISLLASENVPVRKEFVFDWQGSSYWGSSIDNSKVQVKLNFKNAEANALGIPLPKGIVRVYKADSEGQLQFLGEDEIDHTPKDEERKLFIGNAFDIAGEGRQTDSRDISKGVYQTSYEVTLRNHKDQAVEVVVPARLGSSWEITRSSMNYNKKDASTVEFVVPVPAGGEKTITYTVEYRWSY